MGAQAGGGATRSPLLRFFGLGRFSVMPELARFFGIIVRMYLETGAPHHRPHFHAYYHNDVAIYGVDDVEILAGHLPRKQQRLVEAWAELHQAELLEAWDRLQRGMLPERIDPLS